MPKLRDRVGRIARELATIVVGVLIALWADGLAQHRAERQRLESHLLAVGDELRGEIETLGTLLERLQSEASSLESLARIGATGDLPPDSVLIDLVYSGLLDVTIFEPSLSAVGDLQSSGLVPLIEDLDLRLGLSGLRQSVGTSASNAVVNRSGPQQQLFDPFVLRELPFVWRSLPAIQHVAPMRNGVLSWDPLLDDQGQAMVTMRYDFVLATAEDWQNLRGEIERLVELVDGELRSR